MIRRLFLIGALSIALAPPAFAQAAKDWTRTFSRTPAGAFVMGNPAAKVKLVEYLSMTCSHCAHFTGEASGPLRATYIRSGKVSIEMRHALRDGFDFAASLLARCDGPGPYFAASEAVFAAQPDWGAKASAWAATPAAQAEMPVNQRLAAFTQGSGLDALFRKRGMTPIKIAACLASKPEQDVLGNMAREAWEVRKIGGTPAFLINGKPVDGVTDWSGLEPRIKEALR